MVFSAFKSTSRRGTASTNSSKEERIPNRRSRSVSAVSRTVDGSVPSNSSVSDEFLNMRDNPLYCYSSSSSSSALLPGAEASAADSNARRGRPVSRGLGAGSQSPGIDRSGMNARSLSRVDTGGRRLRSVSREHHENLEADMELRFKSTASLRCKEDGMTATDVKEETRSLHKWTGRHPVSESWDASGFLSSIFNLASLMPISRSPHLAAAVAVVVLALVSAAIVEVYFEEKFDVCLSRLKKTFVIGIISNG